MKKRDPLSAVVEKIQCLFSSFVLLQIKISIELW